MCFLMPLTKQRKALQVVIVLCLEFTWDQLNQWRKETVLAWQSPWSLPTLTLCPDALLLFPDYQLPPSPLQRDLGPSCNPQYQPQAWGCEFTASGPGPPEPPERAGLCHVPRFGRVCSSLKRTTGQAGVKLSQSTHSARQVVYFRLQPRPARQVGSLPSAIPGPDSNTRDGSGPG